MFIIYCCTFLKGLKNYLLLFIDRYVHRPTWNIQNTIYISQQETQIAWEVNLSLGANCPTAQGALAKICPTCLCCPIGVPLTDTSDKGGTWAGTKQPKNLLGERNSKLCSRFSSTWIWSQWGMAKSRAQLLNVYNNHSPASRNSRFVLKHTLLCPWASSFHKYLCSISGILPELYKKV